MKPAPKPVVVVDDEKSYTDLITQMLADNLHCPVHSFARPLDALRALPQIDPGVVVTDYNMPQVNGLEFIRQAMPLVPRTTFVLITGHDLSAYQDEMDRLTALKGFLAKPFGTRKLMAEILRVWPDGQVAPSIRSHA